HARFQSAHVRDRSSASPMADEAPVWIKHLLIAKCAVRRGLTEFAEDLFRDRNCFHARRDNLKSSRMQSDFGITYMQSSCKRFRRLQKCRKLSFPPPNHERTTDKFGLRGKNESQIISRVHGPSIARLGQIVVKQFSAGNRTIEV